MPTSPPIPPVLLKLDGKTTSLTQQVKFFQRNENIAVTKRTSIILKHIDFNESAILTAAIQFFQVHQQKGSRNDDVLSTTPSSSSSSAYFESFTLSEMCLSPFLDVFLEKVIRMDLFRTITFKSPSHYSPSVSMRVFDVQCGGFPSRLECLVLDGFCVTELDAGYLAGALGNNGNGDGDGDDGRYLCGGLRHLTMLQSRCEAGARHILCDGLRRNQSLRQFNTFNIDPCNSEWLLVPLSEHPQLTHVYMNLSITRALVDILPSLSVPKNVRVLKMIIIAGIMKDTQRIEFARHVLRLMTTNPRLSHVCILHCGFTCITPTLPELDLRIRHMADLNYAGRSLVMQEERNGSIEQGTTRDRAVAAGTGAGVVPLGLWPLVLERTLQRSWPTSGCTAGGASRGYDDEGWNHTTCCPWWNDNIVGGWVPTNTFNGIYHLLIRRGPILQHLLHRDPPDSQEALPSDPVVLFDDVFG